MRPVQGDKSKTEFTMITHVNPGGVVNNALGAAIVNRVLPSPLAAMFEGKGMSATRSGSSGDTDSAHLLMCVSLSMHPRL